MTSRKPAAICVPARYVQSLPLVLLVGLISVGCGTAGEYPVRTLPAPKLDPAEESAQQVSRTRLAKARRAAPGLAAVQLPTPPRIWNSGATLSGPPAVTQDGRLLVANREGSLDLLTSSGTLLFSVTLPSAALGSPWVDERGTSYVATTRGVLVATRSNGSRAWSFRAPYGIERGLAWVPSLGLLLCGRSGIVHAVGRNGATLLVARVGGRVSAGPRAMGKVAVLGTEQGLVVYLERSGRKRSVEVGGPVTSLYSTDSRIWAVAGKRAILLDRDGKTLGKFNHVKALAGCAKRGQIALLRADFSVAWRSVDGSLIAKQSLSKKDRAGLGPKPALALDEQGRIWLAGRSGGLVVLDPQGAVGRWQLGNDWLLTPVPQPRDRRVLVGTSSGVVFAVPWLAHASSPLAAGGDDVTVR